MNNTTNTTGNPTIPSSSEAERIFKIVFYVFLFLVGTIGNFLVVVIIKAKHRHRTVNDYFILNLAISDLTFLCFALPFYYYELFEKFTKFQFYCKFVWPMMSVSLFVSIFTLTLMAIERCRAILFPFRPRIKKQTLFMGIISVWTLSIICIVPLMIVSNADGVYCKEQWPKFDHRKLYTALLFVLQFVIPVLIIAIAYITIAITLVTAKVPNRISINNHGQLVKQKSRTDNLHIIRTVAIIVVLFVICMLPNQMAWILTDFGGKQYENLSEKFWLFSEALMFFHSCINPVIYGSLTRQFREGYIRYINFVCCCGRSNKKLTIHLTDNHQHVTRTGGTHHCRLAYKGSLMSPSSVNGVRSSFQRPTRITSCHMNTTPVTSRSPPCSSRSPPNSARPHPNSIRTSPISARLHSIRLHSNTARPPSPLIIDNRMTTIGAKMSSVAMGDKKTEINENDIFSTNPIVHCKTCGPEELLSGNRGDLSERRKHISTEDKITPSELNLGVKPTNLDLIISTVLENPHAKDTEKHSSQIMDTSKHAKTTADNWLQNRCSSSQSELNSITKKSNASLPASQSELNYNKEKNNESLHASQSELNSTKEKSNESLHASQPELNYITDKMDELDLSSSDMIDGCCSPCSNSSYNHEVNNEDSDEPAVQDTYL